MCNVEGLYNQQIDEDPLKFALNMSFRWHHCRNSFVVLAVDKKNAGCLFLHQEATPELRLYLLGWTLNII